MLDRLVLPGVSVKFYVLGVDRVIVLGVEC